MGQMYLVLENFPRHKRFKMDNVIIVGCIPGPIEPKLSVNSFYWQVDGAVAWYTHIKSGSAFGEVYAITSISADFPATRK